jgi:UDP-glucose 4-epimerase
MIEDLVTGGAGFIGSNLAERIVAERGAVRVLDDLSTGHRENLTHLGDRVDLHVGSVTDPEATSRACAGVRRVYHLAAIVAVERTVAEPALAEEVNVLGTLRMLESARAVGAERFVLASSAAVYGDEPALPQSEDALPRPISPYGVS